MSIELFFFPLLLSGYYRFTGARIISIVSDDCILSSSALSYVVFGGARGVVVIVVGNEHGDTSSNPGQDCISHSTNTLRKGMNPIILPPAMGK